MKIQKLNYSHPERKDFSSWQINDLQLIDFNLLVGKNATGKSRTIMLIYSFAKMLNNERPLMFGDWNITFIDNSELFEYKVSITNKVEEEELKINGVLKIKRKQEDLCELFSETQKEWKKISPPKDKLIIHVRRDIAEHPYLELLATWAKNVFCFKFGNINPNLISIDKNIDKLTSIDDIATLLDDIGDEKENIIQSFNSLGYNITHIFTLDIKGEDILYVKENDVNKPISQFYLSQGMFRCITLLIFIEYLLKKNKPQAILIDDLGEGLDYERATELGKFLFEKLKNTNIQIITTSNDNFLMDVIDIKYWNILVKKNNKIETFNYGNSSEKFREFKFSGLSNFSLFSSDYLL